MRVVAGFLGGRIFTSPKSKRTHPMSEKVRGAMFNSLGDITDMTVLDCFTGSGSLAIEAVSRGAKQVTAIDIDNSAITTVVKTAKELGIAGRLKAIRTNATSWSSKNKGKLYDIVICDPPYDDINRTILEKMAHHVTLNGIIALSLPPKADVYLPSDTFNMIHTKNYGDAELAFYRKTK